MGETYTCKECETLYDDTDGDIEKGLCDDCFDMLAEQKRQCEIKSIMEKLDGLIFNLNEVHCSSCKKVLTKDDAVFADGHYWCIACNDDWDDFTTRMTA